MSNDSYAGHTDLTDASNDYSQIVSITKQLQAEQAGSGIVMIVAVHPPPDGKAYGTVDVMPQVHQIDGNGNAVPHGVIYGVPYARMQGGASAVIMDPVVGDKGVCVFADRDISTVQNTGAAAPPASRRLNSMSDAMYVGGMLNGTPTQFVDFTGGEIKIVSPNKITLQAPEIDLKTPTVKVDGDVLVNNSTISSQHHKHQAEGATSQTSEPIAP